MDKKIIEEKFLSAFDRIEKDVENCRLELIKLVEKFIANKKKDDEKLLVVNSPESRIKHKDRFLAKFYRNNYLSDWEIDENWTDDKYDEKLRENLSDLIGLRILCYFVKDEESLFDGLYNQLASMNPDVIELKNDKVSKDIKGNDVHHIQIFKLQAKYLYNGKYYCFEIQVKAMANDLWGEINHEIVYKTNSYQPDDSFIKDFTNSIHNNLTISDNQLQQFYEKNINDSELINSLFFSQTKEKFLKLHASDRLNKVYHNLFYLYATQNDKQLIQEYVGYSLLPTNNFLRRTPRYFMNDVSSFFYSEYIDKNLKINLLELKSLADEIYIYKDEADFLKHITSNILSRLNNKQNVSQKKNFYSNFGEEQFEYDIDDFNKEIDSLLISKYLKRKYSAFFSVSTYDSRFEHFSFKEKQDIQVVYIELIKNLFEER